MENKRGFVSNIGFIMSMAAFCIGIGNLWKFPYVVGNNGGGAFLLVYLIVLLLAGVPIFLIEVTLGRSAQLAPISGMKKLEGKKKTGWSAIGWLGAAAIFIINSFAIMIVGGWTGGYIVKIATGSLKGLSAEEMSSVFNQFAGSPQSLITSAIEALLLLLCLNSGIKKGIEKVCSILLPILFIIMIGLVVFSNTLPGSGQGFMWYLTPDFSKINLSVISSAVTQVFFSLGIGMCCAFVYGSYNKKDSDIGRSVICTGLLDTLIAVMAGLICTPALFSFDIEPTAGPPLLFITLPQLFNAMGSFGTIFGILFMVCVFFAGFTSLLGGSEALVATITDGTRWSRKRAAILVAGAQFLFSIVFTMSFGDGVISKFRALGMGFFDFADFLASGICLTLGAVLMLAYVIFRWKFEKFMEEANMGAKGKIRVYRWMKPYFTYVLPVILIFACWCIITTYI